MRRWRRIAALLVAVGTLSVPSVAMMPNAAAAGTSSGPHATPRAASGAVSTAGGSALPKGVTRAFSASASEPNGEVDIAAQGPDGHTLVYYFAFLGKGFQGPFTVGPQDPGVQPAMVVRSSGELDIVTIYQGHLEYYFNFPGGPFNGPVQIGTGTFSDDAFPVMVDRNVNEVDVAAITTSGQVDYFWDFPGKPFQGPAVVQTNAMDGATTMSLAMAIRPNGELDLVTNTAATANAAQNSLRYYWDFPGSPFQGPAPVTGSAVWGQAVGLAVRPNGEADVGYSTFNGATYATYFATDAPGHPFAAPALINNNEVYDSMLARPTGEDDLTTLNLTSATDEPVDYRWSFTGAIFGGPITAFDPKGNALISATSMGLTNDGAVRAADCAEVLNPPNPEAPGIVYFEDFQGQQFNPPGFVGYGCYPTVVTRG